MANLSDRHGRQKMKIEKPVLENFRRFVELDIAFDPSLTVIVGINGAGKTSILDGIAVLVGRLLTRLPQVGGIALSPKDLRVNNGSSLAPGVRCYLQANMAAELATLSPNTGSGQRLSGALAWSASRLRDKSLKTARMVQETLRDDTNVGVSSIDKFAGRLIDAENESQPYRMPIVAYYGTQRATVSAPLKRRNFATSFARFDSLTGALNPAANFKQVFEWIHAKENDEAREQKKRKSFDYQDPELQTVRAAIESFFPRFKNPRTETNPLRFVVDTEYNGVAVSCDLSQLSDGYRTTLALVADLACRMARANPASHTTPNPLELEAVVLIDEIELHLHPGWQQTILADLRRVFPCTQFIVTTHSPQVLTTVAPQCIRIIDWDGSEQSGKPILEVPAFSMGAESQYVLETILGVPPRPADIPIARQLQEYLKLVNENQWDSDRAVALRTTLDTWSGGVEPSLVKADIDIRVRAWKRDARKP
jgi:predicted ATP-binding protein involved in virulence